MQIELIVNEREVVVAVDPAETLSAVLRNRLGLTGTKEACGEGGCGSCTVLVDGVPVLACLTLAARVRGPVRTVEALASETTGLRRRIAATGAVQCGYCTPGQVVTIAAGGTGPGASREDAARRLCGNLCRCSGSVGLVDLLVETDGPTP